MGIDCDDARGLLIDRLMDRLEPGELERLETHLGECPACAGAAEEMAEAWEALEALEIPPAHPGALIRFGRRMERERARAAGGTRSRAPFGTPLRAAAAVALLVGGVLVGRALAPGGAIESTGGGPQFLLLLRGDEPDRRQPAERLFEEYGAWAERLADAGALVAAEALDPGRGRWVVPVTTDDPASTPVGGYFVVEAPSYDSAVAIARASPHAAYGGLVEVRRVIRDR